MPKDRQHLLPYLENVFRQDVFLKHKCLGLAKTAVHNQSFKRFFNDFPCLIPKYELEELADKFQRIVGKISPRSIQKLPRGFLLPRNVEIQIQAFEDMIIKNGIEDLLDDEGKVNQSFLDLFQCKIQLRPRAIVSAYVAAINEHITQRNAILYPDRDLIVETAVFSFLNSNYGNWVKEKIKTSDHDYVLVDPNTQESEIAWSSPRYAPTLFLFVATLTGLGMALMHKHKQPCNEEKEEPSFKPKFK